MSAAKSASAADETAPPIAIVGIGCRYADARGPAEFWEIVHSGRNTVRDVPRHRVELGYDIDHFYDPRPRIPGKISSKKGGFLEHPELFDPEPFGIAPRDALTMEPQQRLMVEVTWDALEDAGIAPESLAGERVAVMLGYMAEDYSRERAGVLGEAAVYRGHDVFTVGGMSHAVLSGRIAFLLGVTGPSFTLDTACSSSLITTHLACESLRRGESKLAIAGGVNLFLSPEGNIALSRSGMLSMSGACKAFDASADGFVRAEGAGVVVLQPLADAIAAGNPIYAVIRGSGISSDGRDGGHMMAPGRKGQAQAMRDAYRMSGISPADVHYVETHGTGTMIGDPVEIGALADVMGPGRAPDRPLRVASVKGNLGHTESASGVAGLIKAALSIRHRKLPAQLHFETPNPIIPWDEIPIQVQSETTDWPYPEAPLVGVNSFGISGTNAHIVLEAPPSQPSAEHTSAAAGSRRSEDATTLKGLTSSDAATLVPFSAHNLDALFARARDQQKDLSEKSGCSLQDLAYTLARRRTQRAHRLAIVADSVEELKDELRLYVEGNPSGALVAGQATADRAGGLTMVFPGQGGQWVGMGRTLLQTESVFAASIDRIDGAYQAHADWSLRAVIEGVVDFDWTTRLDVLQPLLIAVQVALAELWASWGIRPDRVIGQSLGEVAAAYVAGCLTQSDFARIACLRGRMVARASGAGAMAIVSLSRNEAQDSILAYPGRIEIAGVNGPETTIVAGDREPLLEWVDALDRQGVFVRALEVDFASHCFHMDPLLDEFRAGLHQIESLPGKIPFISTVDGRECAGENLGVDYWVRNLREPVAFDLGFACALSAGSQIALEVSPHPSLARPIASMAETAGLEVTHVASISKQQGDRRALLAALSRLFVLGHPVEFSALHPVGQVVSTPLYPYQRKRYWFSRRNRLSQDRATHPLLAARSNASFDPRWQVWDFPLDIDSAGFVSEMRVDEVMTAPAGLYVELGLAAARTLWRDQAVEIARLQLTRPLELEDEEARRFVQVALRQEGPDGGALRISSRISASEPWMLHAAAEIRVVAKPVGSSAKRRDAMNREGTHDVPVNVFLSGLSACGVSLGSTVVREILEEPVEAGGASTKWARLMLPRSVESEWFAYHAHPALVEASLQLLGLQAEAPCAVELESLDAIQFPGGLGSECWVRVNPQNLAQKRGVERAALAADLDFFASDGLFLGSLKGVRGIARKRQEAPNEIRLPSFLEVEWRSAPPQAICAESEIASWIIVSDSALEASLLATEVQKTGASCRFAEKIEDLAELCEVVRRESRGAWGLVVLAWSDHRWGAPVEPLSYRTYRIGSWANAIRSNCLDAREVWVATRGLQLAPGEAGDALRRSSLSGAQVAEEIETFASFAEMQQCRLLDASSDLAHEERVLLAGQIGRAGEDRQFLARGDELFVPRLQKARFAAAERLEASRTWIESPARERNFRGEHRPEGKGVAFHCVDEPKASPGEVIVEMERVSLSRLDILGHLGIESDSAALSPSIGMGFCGVVREVDSDSSPWRPGDQVMGVHRGALARRMSVPENSIVQRPKGLEASEVAALSFPSLVACYALGFVARLRSADRVLVLSAGGAIGHALVRHAIRQGAEVVATASSADRVQALQELGAEACIGSGRCMLGEPATFDVIVGDRSQDDLAALAAILLPGGRLVDLCPAEHGTAPDWGTLSLDQNRSISSVDMRGWLEKAPDQAGELLREIASATDLDVSCVPRTITFPVKSSSRALRFMAQNRHNGAVVLDLSEASRVAIRTASEPNVRDVSALSAGTGTGRFLLTGDASDVLASLETRIRERGCAEILRRVAVTEACVGPSVEGTWTAWIHVAKSDPSQAHSGEMLLEAAAELSISVALRAPTLDVSATNTNTNTDARADGESAGSAAGREWETQLWTDRLRPSSTQKQGAIIRLHASAENPVAAIEEILDASIAAAGTPGELIHLSEDEWAARLQSPSSPLFAEFAELAMSAQGGLDRGMRRAELATLSVGERRKAMGAFVCESLSTLLGYSERQKEALQLSDSLAAVGLDSLMTMELFMTFGRELEMDIAAEWFGVAPTLGSIAEALATQMVEANAQKGGAQ